MRLWHGLSQLLRLANGNVSVRPLVTVCLENICIHLFHSVSSQRCQRKQWWTRYREIGKGIPHYDGLYFVCCVHQPDSPYQHCVEYIFLVFHAHHSAWCVGQKYLFESIFLRPLSTWHSSYSSTRFIRWTDDEAERKGVGERQRRKSRNASKFMHTVEHKTVLKEQREMQRKKTFWNVECRWTAICQGIH